MNLMPDFQKEIPEELLEMMRGGDFKQLPFDMGAWVDAINRQAQEIKDQAREQD